MEEKYYQDNPMVVGGVDVSLPYDEYVANFRKKYPRAQPMSKYNYELVQKNAKRDAKAIGAGTKKAAEEAGTGNWWEQKGPSDEIIENLVGKENPTHEEAMEKIQEVAERGLTPEQQDDLAKVINQYENKVDNKDTIDDTRAIGEKKADETANDAANTAITDSVSEVVTPKENDTPDERNAKGNYNKAMMSIWDAYRNKLIDKETAGYFTIDAIATLAKNLGRSIGNVGAQFSGGTIDNGHDESKWGQRQNALLNEAIGKETESLGGAAGRQAESESLDLQAKRIRNAYTPAQLEQQIEMFKRDLEMADINLDMAHSKTDLINYIKSDKDYAKSPFKMGLVAYLTQVGAAGAANNASKTLGDAINWMLTFIK